MNVAPSHSVLVANLASPEIDRLAAELERRGALAGYVRPYVNKQRRIERLIERTPGAGKLFQRTLGRRRAVSGLPPEKVWEAALMPDFAGALVGRFPWIGTNARNRYARQLVFATERAVARKAARCTAGYETVVASYGTARFAFEAARRSGARTILNYPIAHNGYQARFYAEEAQLAPEFAAALPQMDTLPRAYSEQLDAECALADRIFVGSSFARDAFTAMGFEARKIVVNSYGVDTERFRPRTAPREDGIFRVLFVGQIGQRKGISYLFEAYERFRRPDTELHLVGSYVSGREVYERFSGLYRYTPNLPHSMLPTMFHEADVFVFPTLIEGMPLVVLEAMACGVPVITTTHGSSDILRDGVDGFFVPIRDPEAIAARLEQLYRNRALRDELGHNARQQALRYTWEAYARRAADAVLQES